MTVSSETNRIEYAGDGIVVDHPTTFNFAQDVDLKVVLVDSLGVEATQTLTTHYTVTGAGSDSGGTVTMITAPASGEELVIVRDVALTQGADYVPNDPFPAETHEDALDKLTYLVQQLNTTLGRTLRLPDGETDTAIDMELPVDIGGYLSSIFGTDAAGKTRMYAMAELILMDAAAVAITGGSITGITDLAVADGGTGASTAQAARSNLGLTIASHNESRAAVATDRSLTPESIRSREGCSGNCGSHTVNNSTTFIELSSLSATMRKGGTVSIRGFFKVTQAGVGADLKLALVSDSADSFSNEYILYRVYDANGVLLDQGVQTSVSASPPTFQLITDDSAVSYVEVLGTMTVNGSNTQSHEMTMQLAQYAAVGSNTTISSGGWLEVKPMVS